MTVQRQGERLAGNITRDGDDLPRVAGRDANDVNLARVFDMHFQLFAGRKGIAPLDRDARPTHVKHNRVRRRGPQAHALQRFLRRKTGGHNRPSHGVRAAMSNPEFVHCESH